MSKAKKNGREQEKMNGNHLKNSRYWENILPQKQPAEAKSEGKVPDAKNPQRLKELH